MVLHGEERHWTRRRSGFEINADARTKCETDEAQDWRVGKEGNVFRIRSTAIATSTKRLDHVANTRSANMSGVSAREQTL